MQELHAKLYSSQSDPDPKMTPNPAMIPKLTPKWSLFLLLLTLKWSPVNLRNADKTWDCGLLNDKGN